MAIKCSSNWWLNDISIVWETQCFLSLQYDFYISVSGVFAGSRCLIQCQHILFLWQLKKQILIKWDWNGKPVTRTIRASKSIFDFLQQRMVIASPSDVLHDYLSHFGFYPSFAFTPFSQFSNLSALITSSFTPQRLITALTGVANRGLIESNWSALSCEWSKRKALIPRMLCGWWREVPQLKTK